MAFPPPTYMLQPQPCAPTVGQAAQGWTTPPQDLAASRLLHMLQTEIQKLEQKVETALRKNREYEKTIVHLATLSCPLPSQSLRTEHCIICPDCKQEVTHACSSPPPSLSTSPSPRPPLWSRTLSNPTGLPAGPTAQGPNLFSECTIVQPASTSFERLLPPKSLSVSSFASHSLNSSPSTSVAVNPAGLQTHFTNLTSFLGENVAAHTASIISHARPPPPSCSKISPATTPYSTYLEPLPPTSSPPMSVSSSSGSTSSYRPLGRSIVMHSPQNFATLLGKKDMHTDLSPTDSLPPHSAMFSAPKAIMLPFVPDSPATTSEDGEPDWTVTYNSKVKRELDVSLVWSLDMESEFSITCVKFSKDGKYLAVGFKEKGTTKIYDVQTGEKTCTLRDITVEDDYSYNLALCFSPDDLFLAAGGLDNCVCIWEVSKKHVRNILNPSSEGYISCVDFSPDGRLIASCTSGHECGLEIWNWRDGSRKIFYESEIHIRDIRFSPDGKYIVFAAKNDVLIWNLRSGRFIQKVMGHSDWVYSLAFTPDGTRLVSGSRAVKIWDLSLIGTGDWMGDSNAKELLNFRGHTKSVYLVDLSSNGRWVISCSRREICVWNGDNTKLHCKLMTRQHDLPTFVDFSPVYGCLAFSFYNGSTSQILLWKFNQLSDS